MLNLGEIFRCFHTFHALASYYCFIVYNLSRVIVILFPWQEFLVKNADREELMAMLGLFGGIISAIQMYP